MKLSWLLMIFMAESHVGIDNQEINSESYGVISYCCGVFCKCLGSCLKMIFKGLFCCFKGICGCFGSVLKWLIDKISNALVIALVIYLVVLYFSESLKNIFDP